MRVHFAVYARGLRRHSTYRAALVAGLVTNSVFGAINAMVLLAVFSARPEINGYDATDAVTQVFVGQMLITVTMVISAAPSLDLADRVRTGEVAIDLLRPVSLQNWCLAEDLGRATFGFLFRGVPTFLVGVVLFGAVVPSGFVAASLFLTSVVLASLVGFALRYLYALCGFWMLDSRGVWAVSGLLGPVLAGMILPLPLFPPAVGDVLRLLPWASMVQIPAEILLGKESPTGGGVLGGLALQALWAALLLGLGAWLTSVATRRVVIQGG
ncbi:ABC-2 family transporter protein [Nocardiopsis sp. MG754419]|uniref:ABC transporter permease n=1 Tax=Nocardiopsis sp. MG754419 TaxID=2259865 RepID=UPI001BAD3D30|nr:ABC-2 family transporter protein [Nocardiopsis sp. MG754419]MBR8742237.1 ABC transporter permease [Nocardiopsis sp. MG754419]